MNQTAFIPYVFGQGTVSQSLHGASTAHQKVHIEKLTGRPGSIEARLQVFEEAVYEIALLNDRQIPFFRRFIQLYEGKVKLVLPLSSREKHVYSFRIGKITHSLSQRFFLQ